MDYATWGSAQGKGSSWDEIVQRAGLINAVAGSAADSLGQVPLSREKILQMDPDILILPGWVYGNPKGAAAFSARITADPAFRALAAVRTGRVYSMPENLKSSTSQFIAAAVEWLARTAYPGFSHERPALPQGAVPLFLRGHLLPVPRRHCRQHRAPARPG